MTPDDDRDPFEAAWRSEYEQYCEEVGDDDINALLDEAANGD